MDLGLSLASRIIVAFYSHLFFLLNSSGFSIIIFAYFIKHRNAFLCAQGNNFQNVIKCDFHT